MSRIFHPCNFVFRFPQFPPLQFGQIWCRSFLSRCFMSRIFSVPSKGDGPNTSSVWICRKSVQQFPRYPRKPRLIFTFKIIRARDQTRIPCEFGPNPFTGSRDILHINKKVIAPKTEPYAVHCVRQNIVLHFYRIILIALTVIYCFILFCIIYTYSVMYAALRSYDRQVTINLSWFQFVSKCPSDYLCKLWNLFLISQHRRLLLLLHFHCLRRSIGGIMYIHCGLSVCLFER